MNFWNRIDLEQLTEIPVGSLVFLLLILVIILAVVLVIVLYRFNLLKRRYDSFMEGKNGQSLENILQERIKQVDRIADVQLENKQDIQVIMNHFDHTFQKVGMVKYNAFEEMGGKLSFSLALLNRKNDGFILSAMHSREGCFTYIKEIVNGKSIIMLSEEEEEALYAAISDTDRGES